MTVGKQRENWNLRSLFRENLAFLYSAVETMAADGHTGFEDGCFGGGVVDPATGGGYAVHEIAFLFQFLD